MVVDTMVLAYALLKVSGFHEEATRALEVAPSLIAPDSIRAELTNVVWQWIRAEEVTLETGLEVLADAAALVDEFASGDLLWRDALELSVAAGHPAYDTLFVALAMQRDSHVLTYDKRLLRRFPEYTRTPGEVLGLLGEA